MTLSARIEVGPSRRLALLATVLPIGGVLVATGTMAVRWSGAVWLLATLAILACAAVGLARRGQLRDARRHTFIVSQRAEFDVVPDPLDSEGTWQLAESTVVWPGFAMLALRKSDPSISARVERLAVFDAELDRADRRSLGRFLLWSLRGGASRPFGETIRP